MRELCGHNDRAEKPKIPRKSKFITILFLHGASYSPAVVAASPVSLVRLAPKPAKSARRSLCPSDPAAVAAVVVVVAGLFAPAGPAGLVAAVVAAAAVAVDLAGPCSGLDFAAAAVVAAAAFPWL